MSKAPRTPMMEQYFSIKEQHQDAFLFFRLGDFYELFHEDAIEAARLLEITLTSRNPKADEPIPMCGVPHHSAKAYIHRLVELGHKVAICEQMEDPKLTKGMVKREVVRVVTPGTLLDEDALATKENNYLACLTVENDRYYLSYADVSTGELFQTETDKWLQIRNEIHSIKPAELIVDEAFDLELLASLQQLMTLYISRRKQKSLSQQYPNNGYEKLTKEQNSNITFLIAYIYSVQMQSISYLQEPHIYELASYLQMNQYAKQQLEITTSLRTQKKKGSLLWYLDQTKTAMGGRLLHQWLDKPLIDVNALQRRHNLVERLLHHYFERIDLVTAFQTIYDLERLVSRISLGSAGPRDIHQLKKSLENLPLINHILQEINVGEELSHLDRFTYLDEFNDLLRVITDTLVDEPPLSLTEGDLIKEGHDEQLDQYKEALTHGHEWLADLQQRERERTGLKTLKVGFNKVFGYYIEISRLQAQELNDPTYERKQTLANSERFITEELKEIETTILEAQEKAEHLEYLLFVELREHVSTYISSLQALARQVAELDVLCNFANVSEEKNFTRAKRSQQPHEMTLKGSRHPVVEELIGSAAFVSNDLSVTPEKYLLLLTGPNMSGKSTYMRQVAYAVILNQVGCFVPAEEASLPMIDKIFTRIGSADDISVGQSTFMVEMMETNIALQEATPNSLLLFDEIGRGTATYDGMALAQGIIEYIAEKVQAITIFATHYHELTELEDEISTIQNIHVGAKEHEGDLIFLHQILPGSADKSYGIHVAKLAGLPPHLIENSQMILSRLEEKAASLFHSKVQQIALFPEPQPNDKEDQKRVQKIANLDLNTMTPIDALLFLRELQTEIKEDSNG